MNDLRAALRDALETDPRAARPTETDGFAQRD
jgi:hypothetical protein